MSDFGGAAVGRPYFNDPYTTSFEATVTAEREDPRGRWVRLASSYFYPTGGGQECDLGTIGRAAVADVEEDASGDVWHLLSGDGPAVGEKVAATIDAGRRLSNRQQHTGQHVLSAAFEHVLDAYTASSRLGEFEGTIDLERPSLTWDEIERVEEAANGVVFEDRTVQSIVVPPERLGDYPLRKPPKVDGPVRLIVVTDYDVSPCGGTHCTRTGEIGPIKVRRWEKWKGGVRVEFVCGVRALADHQDRVRTLVEAALRAHTSDRDVVEQLERAAGERAALQKTIKRLGEELATAEAAVWAGERASVDGADVPGEAGAWTRRVAERDVSGLKALATAALERGAPLVIVAADAPEPALIVMRPRGDGVDLREIAGALRDAARGKGGGGADLVTIVAADRQGLEAAYALASERLVRSDP
jgi:alanyl-tRNA synthetase